MTVIVLVMTVVIMFMNSSDNGGSTGCSCGSSRSSRVVVGMVIVRIAMELLLVK